MYFCKTINARWFSVENVLYWIRFKACVYELVCVCARGVGVWGEREGGKRSVSWASGVTQEQKLCVCWWIFFFSPKARFYFTYLRAIVGYFGTSVKLFEISQIPVYKADYKEGFFFPFHRGLLGSPLFVYVCGNANGLNYHKISSIRAKGNIVLTFSNNVIN